MIHCNEDTDLMSVGHAAGLYQQDPRILLIMLEGVQAVPRLRLNGLLHFRCADFAKAIAALAEHDAREAAAKAAE